MGTNMSFFKIAVSFRWNLSFAISHLLGRRFWQIQDERDKSEREFRWVENENRTRQPSQRRLQIRCNGKDSNVGGEYTLNLVKKTNAIRLRVKNISQESPIL
jgi:hypothetical protein